MPKKRAIMLISWFGEHASIIMTGLAFFVVALGIWNLVLYLDVRNQQSRLSGIEIARIVEQRANNANAVTNCRTSISTISTANVLIGTIKSDLLQRANANRTLAMVEKNPSLKTARLKAARQAESKADRLNLFPPRTQQYCDDLAAKLRKELLAKYGNKVEQLEKEERASQRSDQR